MRRFLLLPMFLIISVILSSCINLSALLGESTSLKNCFVRKLEIQRNSMNRWMNCLIFLNAKYIQ